MEGFLRSQNYFGLSDTSKGISCKTGKVNLVRFLVRSTLPFFIFSTLVKPGKVKSKVFGKVDLTSLWKGGKMRVTLPGTQVRSVRSKKIKIIRSINMNKLIIGQSDNYVNNIYQIYQNNCLQFVSLNSDLHHILLIHQ